MVSPDVAYCPSVHSKILQNLKHQQPKKFYLEPKPKTHPEKETQVLNILEQWLVTVVSKRNWET